MTETAQRLAAFPSLYRSLEEAVRERVGTLSASSGGSPLPIAAPAYDFLHHPHQSGHLGMVDLLATLDLVTRAQLGHSAQQFYGTDRNLATVESACMYLQAQLPILETTEAWTVEAASLIEAALDQTLSRIDVSTIRLQFDGEIRAARKALTDATEDNRPALEILAGRDYIDFEGAWFDRITDRYLAATSAFGWVAFVKAELKWLHHQAMSILGLSPPNSAPITECPLCLDGEDGLIRLVVEQDSAQAFAQCDVKRHHCWPLDGTTQGAEAVFKAYRTELGWDPQPISA